MSKSLTVNPSSQETCPQEMQASCARSPFHRRMSTRSDPHLQKRRTATDTDCSLRSEGKANQRACAVAFSTRARRVF